LGFTPAYDGQNNPDKCEHILKATTVDTLVMRHRLLATLDLLIVDARAGDRPPEADKPDYLVPVDPYPDGSEPRDFSPPAFRRALRPGWPMTAKAILNEIKMWGPNS
jgi:hypothetical protein